MIKESEYCSKVIESEFRKPFVKNKTDHEYSENSTKCWIYKNTYEKGEVKVKKK